MYTAMPQKIAEDAKRHGSIMLTRAAAWSSSFSEVFVPYEASYFPKNGKGSKIRIARFYSTVEKSKASYERVSLHSNLIGEEKAVTIMLMEMLVDTLILDAAGIGLKVIEIESKHPDMAGILFDRKFEIRTKDENVEGKRNVREVTKKAGKTN